jgi:hypothetical protein
VSASGEVFLVLINLTHSEDRGHVSVQNSQYWVYAKGKQDAAAVAAKYARQKYAPTLIADSIPRVLSLADWGESYFDRISEEDINPG